MIFKDINSNNTRVNNIPLDHVQFPRHRQILRTTKPMLGVECTFTARDT